MTERTEQQGRAPGSSAGPDPDRTQALSLDDLTVEHDTTRGAGPDGDQEPRIREDQPQDAREQDLRAQDRRDREFRDRESGDRESGDREFRDQTRDADRAQQDRAEQDRAEQDRVDQDQVDRADRSPRSGVAGVVPGRGETAAGPQAAQGAPLPSAAVPRRGQDETPRTRPVPLTKEGRDDASPPGGGTPRPGHRAGAPAARPSGTAGRQRRARLRLRSIDPWSVFVLSLLISLFLAVVLVVAVVALYAVLQAAGVPDSVNALYAEVTRAPGGTEPEPLLSASRALTTAGVVAVVDVVLLTALATLSAVLYNVCASFTGGIEVTLAEHDG